MAERGNRDQDNRNQENRNQGNQGQGNRGFAAMDDEKQHEIASQGGQRVKELVEEGKMYEREHGMSEEEDEGQGNQRTRGGTREQHVEAGRKGGQASQGGRSAENTESSRRGGTREQHAEAGRQSHKND